MASEVLDMQSFMRIEGLMLRRFFDRLESRGWRGDKAELRNDDLVREAKAYAAYCNVVFGTEWNHNHILSACLRRGLVYTYGTADHFKISWPLVEGLVTVHAV